MRAGPVAGLLMSLVFAGILTLAQAVDLMLPALWPVMGAPSPVTLRLPGGLQPSREPGGPRLVWAADRTVVARGESLDPARPDHQAALAWAVQQRERHGAARLLGSFAIFFTLAAALTAYLRKFGQNRLRLLRAQAGLLGAMGLFFLGAKALLLLTSLTALWIPVSTVALWVAGGFDRRTGFVVTVVLSLTVAVLLQFDALLLATLLARGMASTLSHADRKRRRHLLLSGLVGGVAAALVYSAIRVAFEGHFSVSADLAMGSGSDLIGCVGGGLLGGVLAVLGRGGAERLLGNVSRERLLDLADLEQPLLQKLAREAPGTWEHSRAMANLAEQAAAAIGADALLTRVGAYYHDVGKTAQAKCFVENLAPDERSPHDELSPRESAEIIMAHVVVGTRLLRSAGVPEPVVEFAYTHHGTQLVEYFWNKCQEQGNPEGLSEAAFRYPGMRPQSKETAILMLVDSIEAASRTIDQPERARFQALVQRVVFTKLESGQLDDCGLGLSDLRVIATRMTDTLVNMNHHRIKYPWQVQRAEQFGVPSSAVREGAPLRAAKAPPPATPSEPPLPDSRRVARGGGGR